MGNWHLQRGGGYRRWLVVNPNIVNALGQPVGYQLVPAGNVVPFAHADSSFIRLRRWYAPAPAFVLQRLLFHADAEAVLQLVERCEAAAIEGLIPNAPERLPGRLVVAAEQACRLLHCLCFVLPGHRHLPFRWDR